MAKLIVGCGYLGLRVANLWLAAGDEVLASTRSASRAEHFTRLGLHPVIADITSGELQRLPPAETVLFAVGYDRQCGLPIHDVYVGGLQRTLGAVDESVRRFIYISSTGVYGQTSGEQVDEDSPTDPQREGGRACLAAERVLAQHPLGKRAIILRLAGIYGPGRIPFRRELEAGVPLATPSEGTLNLIHVDDAAQLVLDAESRATAPQTFVVSDGHPVRRAEYYAELSRLLGAPSPTFRDIVPDSPAADRATSNKRIRNARVSEILKPQWKYPSYREGLAAILSADEESS